MAYLPQESDILRALYTLGLIGLASLESHFINMHPSVDLDALHTCLARLVKRDAVIAREIDGVLLWGLPGTWT